MEAAFGTFSRGRSVWLVDPHFCGVNDEDGVIVAESGPEEDDQANLVAGLDATRALFC